MTGQEARDEACAYCATVRRMDAKYGSDVGACMKHRAEARDDEREARRAMIEAAVRAITPNVTNETAAWNTWNNLASDPDFVRAIVTLHAEQHGYRKHPEPEITEAPDLSDSAVVYDLVNEHVTLPGLIEHARRQAEWCCEKGCGTGACESCPCCAAGWCVSGIDGIPDESEGFDQWLEVAAEHNPLAARLQAALRVPVGEGKQAEADSFAPGECTGASECDAPIHVHGCYRPHRADQCDAPEEYGHIPPAGEGEQ